MSKLTQNRRKILNIAPLRAFAGILNFFALKNKFGRKIQNNGQFKFQTFLTLALRLENFRDWNRDAPTWRRLEDHPLKISRRNWRAQMCFKTTLIASDEINRHKSLFGKWAVVTPKMIECRDHLVNSVDSLLTIRSICNTPMSALARADLLTSS